MLKKIIHPKVSVVVISYNQQEFIKKAIDSILIQKVNFDIEVIVADDASIDQTQEIILEYSKKYSPQLKPILRKNNIGVQRNLIDALQKAKGDYIALCEGDDYWIDPNKLQIQVDFLEKNTNFTLCFHPVKVFFENSDQKEYIYPQETHNKKFILSNLLENNFIQTNSVMYRKQSYESLPDNILPFDWYLHLYHAKFGKIGFINRIMSKYRRHENGMWQDMYNNSDHLYMLHSIEQVSLYEELLKMFGGTKENAGIIVKHIYNFYNILQGIDSRSGSNLVQQSIQSSPKTIEIYLSEQNNIISKLQSENLVFQQDVMQRDQEIYEIKSSKLWKIGESYRKLKCFIVKNKF